MIPKNYPLFLLFRLAPRLFVFQVLWLGLAITNRAFVPLCRGLLESLFLVPKVFAKGRDIQSKRLLSEANLLAKFQESEARIWRTTLLKISRAGRQQARPRVCLCGRGRVKEEKRSLRRLTALVVTSHGKIAHAPAGMI